VTTDHDIYCWGDNAEGQASGGGMVVIAPNLILIPDVLDVPQPLVVGNSHTCVATVDGVYCWGRAHRAQTGGPAGPSDGDPRKADGVLFHGAMLGGGEHACSFGATAHSCWGNNDSGELGNGDAMYRFTGNSSALATAHPGTAFAAYGNTHSCRWTGVTLECWGANERGQRGTAPSARSAYPATISVGASLIGLSAHDGHTCAQTTAGVVQCWGDNDFGQSGAGTVGGTSLPTTISQGEFTVAALSKGPSARHTCAIAATGEILCWGDNSDGQCGTDPVANMVITTPSVVE
jgi:alpha-tubulin suppressor-like RCC1 family protein